jgi:hypothetical protein
MKTAQDVGKFLRLKHRPILPPGNVPGTHLCWRLSRPQNYSASGRICQWKIPMKPVGIEPTNFRLVGQYTKYCTNAKPYISYCMGVPFLRCCLHAQCFSVSKSVLFLSVRYVSGMFVVNSTGVNTDKDKFYRSTPNERNMTYFAYRRNNGTIISDLTIVWVDGCVVEWGKHQKLHGVMNIRMCVSTANIH